MVCFNLLRWNDAWVVQGRRARVILRVVLHFSAPSLRDARRRSFFQFIFGAIIAVAIRQFLLRLNVLAEDGQVLQVFLHEGLLSGQLRELLAMLVNHIKSPIEQADFLSKLLLLVGRSARDGQALEHNGMAAGTHVTLTGLTALGRVGTPRAGILAEW